MVETIAQATAIVNGTLFEAETKQGEQKYDLVDNLLMDTEVIKESIRFDEEQWNAEKDEFLGFLNTVVQGHFKRNGVRPSHIMLAPTHIDSTEECERISLKENVMDVLMGNFGKHYLDILLADHGAIRVSVNHKGKATDYDLYVVTMHNLKYLIEQKAAGQSIVDVLSREFLPVHAEMALEHRYAELFKEWSTNPEAE